MLANIHGTPMMTYISDMFRREWTNLAFCDYGTDTSYTHSQTYEHMVRLQMLFDLYGLKAGDKVALCDKNSSNWAVSFLAIFTHNMVAVPLLSDFHIDQIDSLVEHSEARLLITNHAVYEKAATTDRSIMIDITTFAPFDTEADTPLARAYKQVDAEFSRRYPNGMTPDDVKIDDVDLEDLALISYTSGSTGNPKGVMLPYRTFWSNVVFCHDFLPPVPDGCKFMSILPMAHMYGFSVEFLSATGGDSAPHSRKNHTRQGVPTTAHTQDAPAARHPGRETHSIQENTQDTIRTLRRPVLRTHIRRCSPQP